MTFPDYSLEKVIYSATVSPLKEYAFPFSYVNANLRNLFNAEKQSMHILPYCFTKYNKSPLKTSNFSLFY